jgi:hypothetical protein
MLLINTKKLLLCMVFVFTESSCMEITQLPNDVIQPIAGRLTLIERHNLKNSCKNLHQKLSEDPLFLSPFNSDNYHKFIRAQYNYLPLEQITSAGIILKLKIFAARQEDKEKKIFCDLIARCPEKGCEVWGCKFNSGSLKELVRVYAKEWQWGKKKGNKDHYRHFIDIIESHHCEPHFDLALAQGIDVNACDSCYKTALGVTCSRDEYAWATQKLIDHPLCNVNVTWGMYSTTPLKGILFSVNPDVNIKNLRILLTRADLTIVGLWGCIKNITDGKVKNLLLTAYPFLDERINCS